MKHKRVALKAIVLASILIGGLAPLLGQGSRFDNYVLSKASILDGANGEIEVLFGGGLQAPSNELGKDRKNWVLYEEGNTLTGVRIHYPKKVIIESGSLVDSGTVKLTFPTPLDSATRRYKIRFRGGKNIAEIFVDGVQIQEAPKPGSYTAATGKSDADLYLSGTVTGARGSGPLYSIEAIAKFSWPTSFGDWGGGATFISDEGADIDPDSITASGTWSKVIVLDTATGLIIDSNFAAGEFDKKGETRNFKSDLTGQFVLPPISLSESAFTAFDFTAGFEAGHNFEHKLDPDGLGGFWRWVVGANARMIVFHPWENGRIDVTGEYRLRLPRSAEPFTEKLNGLDITSLTRKPRHYVGADVDFMLSKYLGVTLKYRYGSLPPAFSFVDHRISAGLTFKAKQSR